MISFNRDDATAAKDATKPASASSLRAPAEMEAIAHFILDAAFEVHRLLGPGLLESAYQACFSYEMRQLKLKVECEIPLTLKYKDNEIPIGYRIDMLVNNAIVIENKVVECLERIHRAQVLTYLKLTGCTLGFLINWNVVHLKHGLKRVVLGHPTLPLAWEKPQSDGKSAAQK